MIGQWCHTFLRSCRPQEPTTRASLNYRPKFAQHTASSFPGHPRKEAVIAARQNSVVATRHIQHLVQQRPQVLALCCCRVNHLLLDQQAVSTRQPRLACTLNVLWGSVPVLGLGGRLRHARSVLTQGGHAGEESVCVCGGGGDDVMCLMGTGIAEQTYLSIVSVDSLLDHPLLLELNLRPPALLPGPPHPSHLDPHNADGPKGHLP